jgi:NAD(P)-dependent dehydrogenase (short-subunit alcohol dehydrogenase family)
MTESLDASRIALVTGASRGIGRAAAVALASEGAHVIAVARTQGSLEALDDDIRAAHPGATATLVPLDLADHEALDRLGASIFERWGRLDVFVGNAALLGPISPLPHISPKAFADVFNVNVTANWRLMRSLDLLLRAAPAGRVAFLTSAVASRAEARAYWGLYAASKAALDLLARTYAAETVNTTKIKVMLANPGKMRTRMRAAAMPGEDPETLPKPEEFAPKLLRLLSPEWSETGKLYDFPTDSVLSFRDPA